MTRGDAVGGAIGAAVVGFGAGIEVAASGASAIAVIVDSLAAAAGIVAAFAIWLVGGRPAPATMLRRRPAISVLALFALVLGLLPAALR